MEFQGSIYFFKVSLRVRVKVSDPRVVNIFDFHILIVVGKIYIRKDYVTLFSIVTLIFVLNELFWKLILFTPPLSPYPTINI